MLVQMIHLLPVVFFLRTFKFDKEESLNLLTIGLAISAVIAFVSIRYLIPNAFSDLIPLDWREPLHLALMLFNRVASLFILTKVIIESELKNDD